MISTIIEELSDSTKSLVNPLLKTKVLASRLKNDDLLRWVNSELKGYDQEDENNLPKYRIVKANSNCHIQQGTYVEYNTPIPISYLPEEFARKMFMEFRLYEGVQTLEGYSNHPENDTLGKELPVDFWAMVTREVKKEGANINITNISVSTHVSSITQALSEIRSKFLDLMLSLEEKFPELKSVLDESEETKKEVNESITVIMKQINVENKGDGSSINLGDNSQVNSASGENIQQEITLDRQGAERLKEFIEEIRGTIDQKEFDSKGDVQIEFQRIDNQLEKERPNSSIVVQSLETINSFLLNIAANVWTPPIIEGISKMLESIK